MMVAHRTLIQRHFRTFASRIPYNVRERELGSGPWTSQAERPRPLSPPAPKAQGRGGGPGATDAARPRPLRPPAPKAQGRGGGSNGETARAAAVNDGASAPPQ